MDITITLIRHAGTQGGREGQFLGLTDEPLSAEGKAFLSARVSDGAYPQAQIIFCGALTRCRETARIIYPQAPLISMRELNAFDYGCFSGKTYHEIVSDKRFGSWAASAQLLEYPGGEKPHVFASRCGVAFTQIVKELQGKGLCSAAVITHEAVISTILQRFGAPRSLYRSWPVDYGGGYTAKYDVNTGVLRVSGRI